MRIIATLLTLFLYSQSLAQWVQTNGPHGGSVSNLTINERGDLFACDRGIFRSNDGGLNWVQLHLPVTSPVFQAILAMKNSVVLTWLQSDSVSGLFRSLDNGHTWALVFERIPLVKCFSVDSNEIVYAGTASGVYKSTDLGAHWVKADSTFRPYVYTIAITPSGDIFAGTFSTGGGLYGHGVYRSTNHGETWEAYSNGIPDKDIVSLCALKNGSVLLATNIGNVFLSDDQGRRWNQILRDIPLNTVIQNAHGEIFLATRTRGVWQSSNNGSTWVISNLIPAATVLVSDRAGNLFASVSEKGVLKSSDRGYSWAALNAGLIATTVTSLHIDHRRNIWAGTTSGLYRSQDRGMTWLKSDMDNLQGSIGPIAASAKHGTFVGTRGKGLFRSMDNGETWVAVDSTLFDYVTALAIDSAGNIFAVSKYGVARSSNSGNSWSNYFNAYRTSSLCTGKNNSVFFCAMDGIFRSTDAGINWAHVSQVGGTRQLTADRNGNVCVTTNNHGLAISTDNGGNWVFPQVGGYFTNAVAITQKGEIFVSTASLYFAFIHSVFRSTDKGVSWTALLGGLKNRDVASLVAGTNGDVFAGTSGSGVFRMSLPSPPVPPEAEIPTLFHLFQNYPNPFNPSTTIKYQIPSTNRITLEVFDILGCEVATLVNEMKSPGTYTVQWVASGVASGVYFYRLKAGSFVQTRKLALIR